MKDENTVFRLLAKPIQNALKELGLSKPTKPQVKAVPFILNGENVLLVAPTGTGKTEAVLLPIFSRILEMPEKQGISVLYITPLRALNRDLLKRMSYWATKLSLSIQVRHGDTEIKIRRKQATHPPDVLVTTPETLQAILPGQRMQKHLSQVSCVIIDEVHSIAEDKRGVQLSVALERLYELDSAGFQRIGLSATVESPEKVAAFIAGAGRPIRIVDVSLPKAYSYTVKFPTPKDVDYDLAEKLNTAPEAAARIRYMLDLVRKHKSTLIFVNSRTNAEMLGHKFGLLTDDIAVHHGSLSKVERKEIEDAFKANKLRAIVCTSTMELGIDIGQVDLVIQYLSPRQVGSLIQRVGRSGHRLDLVSKGIIITAFSEDFLESFAAALKASEGWLEQTLIHENPLDVVAHQIAGILMDKNTIAVDDAIKIFRRAYPFRSLTKTKFLDVVKFVETLREVKLDGDVLEKTNRTRDYYYRNLSMIPDERRYPIVDIISDRKIGTLGDEFMALRARIGLNFICRGRVWRIVQIEDETGSVFVVPSEDKFGAVPGWDGEMLPISYELCKKVGKLREKIAEEIHKYKELDSVAESLAETLSLEKNVLIEPIREVNSFLMENITLPTHNNILLEGFDKYIVVHACFGEIVNRTLGSIFDVLLSNHDLIIGWWNDGYRILIETPRKVKTETLEEIRKLLFNLSPKDIDRAFDEYVEARFPFSYKMKFVAERFGVMPRGKTMSPERMAELPSRFKGTPVYDETVREAFVEKVDVSTVKYIMRAIRKGEVKISALVRFESPTPLAYHIFAKYAEVTELMTPKHVVLSNIDRMRRSILLRHARLFCLSCGNLIQEKRIRDLCEKPVCEKCNSGLLAKLTRKQNPDTLYILLKRRRKGDQLTPEELNELIYSRRTADLVLSYGVKAIIALQVKGVGPETAFRILGKMHPEEDQFYMDLLKAKIQYLRTKPFWDKKEKIN